MRKLEIEITKKSQVIEFLSQRLCLAEAEIRALLIKIEGGQQENESKDERHVRIIETIRNHEETLSAF